MVHAHATRGEAKAALTERWNAQRQERPDQSQMILAYTRADVRDLNAGARAKLHEAGELGADHVLQTERGERMFATGDRLMFLRNERSMEVKNGTLGTVRAIERASGAGPEASARLTVRLDGRDGRTVSFDLKDYDQCDHGYAATIHKTQGVTVDRAHVLATGHMDRHAVYVGLSRHREGVELHYGREDMADHRQLVRTLSRERAKDVTLDYSEGFAERRGITPESEIRVSERMFALSQADQREHEPQRRGMFAGRKLSAGERTGGERNAGEHIAATPEQATDRDHQPSSPFSGLQINRGSVNAARTGADRFAGLRIDASGFEPRASGRSQEAGHGSKSFEQEPTHNLAVDHRAAPVIMMFAKAHGEMALVKSENLVLPHHRRALKQASRLLDGTLGPEQAGDVRTALARQPELGRSMVEAYRLRTLEARDTAQAASLEAIGKAADHEQMVRHDPELRRERQIEVERSRARTIERDIGYGYER